MYVIKSKIIIAKNNNLKYLQDQFPAEKKSPSKQEIEVISTSDVINHLSSQRKK